ncbi:retrovirus-related Pol polyprotein from transposon 17.6 [Ixodes scapularis]
MCPITPATPGLIVPGSSDFAARAPCADLRRETSFGDTPSLGAPENASFFSVLSPQSEGKEIFVTRLNTRTTSADMVLQRLLQLVRPWPPLGHLSLLSKMLSRHAPYLTFPFPGHLHHIRFGALIHISDLRLELNPLLPLYPYLPLRLLNRAAVGHVEELQNSAEINAIADESSPTQQDFTSPAQLDIDPKLPDLKRPQLSDLLAEYRDCFATSSKVRQTAVAKHRIVTEDDARPVHRSPYRVSVKEREVIQEQVQEMLNDDIIQPSSSPWASPVVLVKKKDGTLRFCVDYRQLNAVTKKDVYPLPRIDDTLDRLRHSRYFSSMDLKSGYWQIEVDERDREKTAFVTPDGLYEFKVMPFGLCTAPATFQRVMDTVLAGLKWQSCLVYL